MTTAANYKTKNFESLDEIILQMAEQLRPPERISVAEAASKYRKVNNPGSYVGPWDNSIAPYMIEPMNMLSSRDYTNMAFVGPAQSGKTDAIIVNGAAYNIRVEPMDTIIYCPTGSAARDFSMRRIDRLHRHSPEIGACLLPSGNSDNTYDKHYISGMMLSLSWPSVTELAGRPIGRVIMTDYDRMPEDVDGDGSPFDLADKRTTTFNSFRMCAAESSPSRAITNLKWSPKTPHEAPPCTGIMDLYNRGDRRRWQWPCPHCNTYFEGLFSHLTWSRGALNSNYEISLTTHMVCPHCDEKIAPDERKEMQLWGMWVPDGMRVNSNGQLEGEKPRTTFASFWLRGTAAAFVTWQKLVQMYLDAMDAYERTKSDDALRKFWNTDMGEPYSPVDMDNVRLPETLHARAEDVGVKKVPVGARFLVAMVDVQKNSFRVRVDGIGAGTPFDTYVVDTFEIRKSERVDVDGDRYMVKPSAYLEDWDLLISGVMEKEYELDDGSGRMMAIKLTACDSGGRAGVTDKAYDFYRKLKADNKHGRFVLVKGDPTKGAPRTRLGFPDSQRKTNASGARGDIPVLFLGSNLIKDMLNGRLDVIEPGKGMFHMPDWLPDDFFAEMCAETRNEKGQWENTGNIRNEEWDLSCYMLAMCISPKLLNVEALNWEDPPRWADDWDNNSMVRNPDTARRFAVKQNSTYDISQLAAQLG